MRTCKRMYRIKVAAFMCNAPTVHPSHRFAEHRPRLLQCGVSVAHDGLTDVIKTVVNMLVLHLVYGDFQIFLVVRLLVPVM